MALPTNGRVIIETSAGEIDIELWSKVSDFYKDGSTGIDTRSIGNAQDMQEFLDSGHGRYLEQQYVHEQNFKMTFSLRIL